MIEITCKKCGIVFVVPSELKNIIKLCPECGKKSAKEAKSIFN
jgi:predicted  nucleic acid-binding Zn-ribbon protein